MAIQKDVIHLIRGHVLVSVKENFNLYTYAIDLLYAAHVKCQVRKTLVSHKSLEIEKIFWMSTLLECLLNFAFRIAYISFSEFRIIYHYSAYFCHKEFPITDFIRY